MRQVLVLNLVAAAAGASVRDLSQPWLGQLIRRNAGATARTLQAPSTSLGRGVGVAGSGAAHMRMSQGQPFASQLACMHAFACRQSSVSRDAHHCVV